MTRCDLGSDGTDPVSGVACMASEEMFSAGDECVSDSHLSFRRVLQSFVDTARAYLPLSPNQILYYG